MAGGYSQAQDRGQDGRGRARVGRVKEALSRLPPAGGLALACRSRNHPVRSSFCQGFLRTLPQRRAARRFSRANMIVKGEKLAGVSVAAGKPAARLPLLKQLGPGLIAGAADDDPSGIATYSQAGAQFGYGMLWSVLFTLPLMIGIQIVSARIGRVTGQGLAANI